MCVHHVRQRLVNSFKQQLHLFSTHTTERVMLGLPKLDVSPLTDIKYLFKKNNQTCPYRFCFKSALEMFQT